MKSRIYGMLGRLGVFWITRRLFRRKLLILCYHGISVSDEHLWWPGVFMTNDKFRRRMELLREKGYQVIALKEALDRLDACTLPDNAVVLTADDGYLNSPQTMVKTCQEFNYPLTIYVTSYYAEKKTPIFNVMVQYVFWKTNKSELRGEFSDIGILGSTNSLDLSNADKRTLYARQVIEFGREQPDELHRQAILKRLCSVLGVDYFSMTNSGTFKLMGSEEIRLVSGLGVDIQLHTHRHRFPEDKQAALREIKENRAFLEPLTGKPLNHFCYPSGLWSSMQLPWLSELKVSSATTCNLGFVSKESGRLSLNRYLDKETICENEFVAEISGFLNLARRIRGKAETLWN